MLLAALRVYYLPICLPLPSLVGAPSLHHPGTPPYHPGYTPYTTRVGRPLGLFWTVLTTKTGRFWASREAQNCSELSLIAVSALFLQFLLFSALSVSSEDLGEGPAKEG